MKPPFKLGDRVICHGASWGGVRVDGKKGTVRNVDVDDGYLSVKLDCPVDDVKTVLVKPEQMELVDGLQVGDLVEIIGPSGAGCDGNVGTRFVISEKSPIGEYSRHGIPWYPASSLRKVCPPPKDDPLTAAFELHVMETHRRLAAIEARLDEQQKTIFGIECAIERIDECQEQKVDLQIGDWVEVVGPDCYGRLGGMHRIFRIAQSHESTNISVCGPWFSMPMMFAYPPESLRKLPDEEITRRLNA